MIENKMIVFRLVAEKYHTAAFDGQGAAKFPGRWNRRGTQVVYTCENIALAMLERLAYSLESIPSATVYFSATVPDSFIAELPDSELPEDWARLPHPESTQFIGSEWVESKASLALRVRSVMAPGSYNILINPNHSHFKHVLISTPQPLPTEPRLEDLVKKAKK
jgi:RES domain-containing protein